jgi:hypothetical protein
MEWVHSSRCVPYSFNSSHKHERPTLGCSSSWARSFRSQELVLRWSANIASLTDLNSVLNLNKEVTLQDNGAHALGHRSMTTGSTRSCKGTSVVPNIAFAPRVEQGGSQAGLRHTSDENDSSQHSKASSSESAMVGEV